MDTITRKEFLSLLGTGATAFAGMVCLGGCSGEDSPTGPGGPTNVDFTIDITNPGYAALQSAGGYVYVNSIVVARAADGSYIAVAQSCTHEGTSVVYEPSNNRFHCPNHGSNFTTDGAVINGPASRPIRRYNTTLTGNSLRVFS